MQNTNVRLTNVALGFWVVISSFIWRKGSANFMNMMVTGLVVIVASLLAIRTPALRYVSAAAGLWLVASLFAFPNYSSPAVWNNCIVGGAIALVALIGPEQARRISS